MSKRASDDREEDCNIKRVKFKHDHAESDLSLDYPDSGESYSTLTDKSESAPENDSDYFPSDYTSDSSTTISRRLPVITRDQQARGLDKVHWPWEDTTYRCSYRCLTIDLTDAMVKALAAAQHKVIGKNLA